MTDPASILALASRLAAEPDLFDSIPSRPSRLKHPAAGKRRTRSVRTDLAIYHRDGFIDRYSGHRVVFPGTLRLVSLLFPAEFPIDPNWNGNPALYRLSPTIDHIVPLMRGGTDRDENLVTTSMLRNGKKGDYLPDEIGWTIHERGDGSWDGLTGWFLAWIEAHPEHATGKIKDWYLVLKAALYAGRFPVGAETAGTARETCR